METSVFSDLPSHLVVDEILSRSSAETVARARTVCKQWNEETHKSSFARRAFEQRQRGERVSGFLVQIQEKHWLRNNFVPGFEGSGKEVSLSFLPEEHRTEVVAAASNQGLILCVKPLRSSAEYIVSKPTTRQWRKIPRPKTRYFSVKHAMAVMGSNPKDQLKYKILRFSLPNSSSFTPKSWVHVYRCEIFDSAAWAWKALPELLSLRHGEFLDGHSQAVSVSGFAYSLTSDKRVVALDWESESLHLIDLPEGTADDHRLVEWEGKLGLACVSDDRKHMELWAYASRVWRMKTRTSLECFGGYDYPHPLAMLCSDVAVVAASYHMSFLKLDLPADQIGRVLKVNQRVFRMPLSDRCFRIESDHVVVNMNKTQAHTASLVDSDHQPRYCSWTPLLLFSICFLVIFTFLYVSCL